MAQVLHYRLRCDTADFLKTGGGEFDRYGEEAVGETLIEQIPGAAKEGDRGLHILFAEDFWASTELDLTAFAPAATQWMFMAFWVKGISFSTTGPVQVAGIHTTAADTDFKVLVSLAGQIVVIAPTDGPDVKSTAISGAGGLHDNGWHWVCAGVQRSSGAGQADGNVAVWVDETKTVTSGGVFWVRLATTVHALLGNSETGFISASEYHIDDIHLAIGDTDEDRPQMPVYGPGPAPGTLMMMGGIGA